jgi:hypothetical protein
MKTTNDTAVYLSKNTEVNIMKTYLHSPKDNKSIHNIQNLETTQISINL